MLSRRGQAPAPAKSPRAFSLLELAVVLVLISALVALAVPALGALTGARLKEEAGRMTGLIRDTYGRTALLGKSTRIVLDMEQHAWWVEETEKVARVHREKLEADRDGKVQLDPKDERIEDIEEDTEDEQEKAKLQLLAPPQFQAIEGDDGKPHKLPDDIKIKAVWAEHLDERVSGGQVALYFFPGGFTEEAQITLSDGDDDDSRILTLVVSSLTGEVEVVEELPRIPYLEEDD
jgi:prepilin-type N-terminal cleavage/methylation domain-containing protein